jgi:hypothetical protein
MITKIIIYAILYVIYTGVAWLIYHIISNEYKKRYIIFVILCGLLLGPVVSTALLILFYFLRKIPNKIIMAVLILICVGVMSFRIVRGYYPLPYFARQIYYAICNDINRIEPIMIDEKFLFWKEGYTIEKTISSPYSLNHSLVLTTQDAQEFITLPTDISDCYIQISIYRDNELIFKRETELVKDIYDQEQRGRSVKYVTLANIPFPLAQRAYKDMTIRVEVIKSDESMEEYLEEGELYLYPDISLE